VQKQGVPGRLEGREPQSVAHPVAREHVPDQVRGPLAVVLDPGGDLAENNLLGGPPAQEHREAIK
jgi:hypothetical protein